jgi:DNA-binding NarL/FixJ family response regulator
VGAVDIQQSVYMAKKTSRVTCVVADDDPMMVSLWEEYMPLIRNVDVVASASCGDDAGPVILEQDPTFAVLDWNMPPGDGIEAARVARLGGYTGPIILVSGEDEFQIPEDLADVWLAPKSAGPDGLTHVLDELGV